MSPVIAPLGRLDIRPTPAPEERTAGPVLVEFVTRVLKQCPRASHVISAEILNNAIAHARAGSN